MEGYESTIGIGLSCMVESFEAGGILQECETEEVFESALAGGRSKFGAEGEGYS